MIVALKMFIGGSDGHSLNLLGVGEAQKIKTSMAYYTFRFRWECPVTSPGGEFNSLLQHWIMYRPLVESPRNERSQGTSGAAMVYVPF